MTTNEMPNLDAQEVERTMEAFGEFEASLENFDFDFLSQILAAGLTPQEELRYRVQERANGRNPGDPVNTAQWRVW